MQNIYPIGGLFFYRLLFMFWLLLGEAMFSFRLEKKNKWGLRAPLVILACFLFALAFPIPTSNSFYAMFMFFMFFIFTYFASFFLFKADWKTLLFSCILGYTTEHLAYETYFCVITFADIYSPYGGGLYSSDLQIFSGLWDELTYFVAFILVYWLVFILWAYRIKSIQSIKENNLIVLVVGLVVIVVNIVFNSISQFFAANYYYNNIYMGIIASFNIMACLLVILFLFEVYYKTNLSKENEIMKELRKEEIAQYELSKETIELINIKCHDMKHQIVQIAKNQSMSEEAIENLSSLINIYDSSIVTSNKTLNVILSQKSLFCSQNGIKFSCVADAEKLGFMNDEDIYSLFGNIIDNAIEAVNDLTEDKKIISLNVKSVGNMLSISTYNFYGGKIVLDNGLPVSSKKDSRYHGFGLKSVKMICEKYHGTLQIKTERETFAISILFILDNQTRK